MDILVIIFILVLIFWVVLVSIYSNKSKLDQNKKNGYLKKIDTLKEKDYTKQIIWYDSILNHILSDVWYKWSIWEQLKKKPHILTNDLNLGTS